MFLQKLSVILIFIFVVLVGCDSQEVTEENTKHQTEGAVILDDIIIEHTPEKIKEFRPS